MLFRQFFDSESSTYSYLLASDSGHEALLIDPVIDKVDMYLKLVEQLDVRLVRAIDTHTHADHITGLGKLREKTGCITVMGEQTEADCVSEKIREGEHIRLDGIDLEALYTPGHTNESYSFLLHSERPAVFTGDVVLIRGSGRTDFQGGDAGQSYDSITKKIFTLPDSTLVYPAHDYKGWTRSSVGEEKAHNPRLAGKSRAEYIDIMNNLDLPDPKMMDVAVPANLDCGLAADA
jgi:glyoxylase-like metal-dependent hydrolase (beta-lactamase superfamily II)